MSVDWLRYSGGTVYACGLGRHHHEYRHHDTGTAQFRTVALHVGNHGEKREGHREEDGVRDIAITLLCNCSLALAAHRDLHPCSLVPTLTAQDDLLLFCSTG